MGRAESEGIIIIILNYLEKGQLLGQEMETLAAGPYTVVKERIPSL